MVHSRSTAEVLLTCWPVADKQELHWCWTSWGPSILMKKIVRPSTRSFSSWSRHAETSQRLRERKLVFQKQHPPRLSCCHFIDCSGKWSNSAWTPTLTTPAALTAITMAVFSTESPGWHIYWHPLWSDALGAFADFLDLLLQSVCTQWHFFSMQSSRNLKQPPERPSRKALESLQFTLVNTFVFILINYLLF